MEVGKSVSSWIDESNSTVYYIIYRYDAFVFTKDGPIEKGQSYNYEDKVLGMYYVKPNYPGRCSHVSYHHLLDIRNLRSRDIM